MNTVNWQGKKWDIIWIRSATQVAGEHPNKKIGELMIKNDFELLLLQEIGYTTIELMIARIHKPREKTFVFRDKTGNLLNPDEFNLE